MPNLALFALLVAAGAMMPGVALGQGPMDVAMAGPQPHFVAAWAPEKEREAEHSAALARRVSLELQNVSLDAALKALTNQAGLRITYSKAVLPAGKRVTIKASDIAVITALTEMLFRSGLDVVVDQDGALALVRCKHVAPRAEVQDSGTIVGTVTDKATGRPLAGATVVIEGTALSATTNSEGQYRIERIAAGTYTARARYIGYAVLSATVTVRAEVEVITDLALEKSVQRLEDVVTTGTIIPTEVKALPTPVTVIDAKDIALQRPRTVQELFRQAVPGAVSWDNAGRPADAAFSVRGASTLNPGSSQMKVFLDGIEQAAATFGAIDPNSIERIEVIRGPQAAAIYGSDAIGGVIQVFSKRGDPSLTRPRVDAQAGLGIVQTPYAGYGGVLRQDYQASVRGGTSDVSYNVGGGYSHTADYLPNGEQSKQSNPSVFGGMRFERGIMTVDLSGRYNVHNNPEVFNPTLSQTGFAYFSRPFYQPSQFENQTVGVRLELAPTRWWHHTLTMGIDQTNVESAQSRARLTTPEDTLLTVYKNTFSKRSIGYLTSVQGSLGSGVSASMMAGIDHYHLPQTSFSTVSAVSSTGELTAGGSISGYRVSTSNSGYFAQGQLGFHDALFLTAGVRAEQNTNFGDSLGTPVSPRLGLSYVRPLGGSTLKFRGGWGRAIRAPDPGVKLSLGPSILPNPAIGPERQHGWDAGVDVTFGAHGSVGVTYYNQTAENLIEFVHIQDEPVPLDQFQNVGRVKNTGIEVEGSLSLGLVQLKATYGYTRARIEELGINYTGDLHVGDQARATPQHTAGVLLTAAPRAGTTMTAGFAYVGRFEQTDAVATFKCLGGTGPCTPDLTFVAEYPSFVKVNAALWQQITPQLSGFVSIHNLTNNDAYEADDILPVMGRVSSVGFRLGY